MRARAHQQGPRACTSAPWGQHLGFHTLGAPHGSGCSLMAARWQVFFVSFPSSLQLSRGGTMANACDIPHLLTWQAVLYFSWPPWCW